MSLETKAKERIIGDVRVSTRSQHSRDELTAACPHSMAIVWPDRLPSAVRVGSVMCARALLTQMWGLGLVSRTGWL
jgi:hypothetical protein